MSTNSSAGVWKLAIVGNWWQHKRNGCCRDCSIILQLCRSMPLQKAGHFKKIMNVLNENGLSRWSIEISRSSTAQHTHAYCHGPGCLDWDSHRCWHLYKCHLYKAITWFMWWKLIAKLKLWSSWIRILSSKSNLLSGKGKKTNWEGLKSSQMNTVRYLHDLLPLEPNPISMCMSSSNNSLVQ